MYSIDPGSPTIQLTPLEVFFKYFFDDIYMYIYIYRGFQKTWNKSLAYIKDNNLTAFKKPSIFST